ncbi:RIP metalloprotease RseP [Streptococcus entericus]|uniref:RIP metalloprotease RseP n=1 Tax=Streptococcus entericus TaxID=155680 RepID=UPI00037EC687|nr:RIP metalloprotease RseP [Streptococcus entericus]
MQGLITFIAIFGILVIIHEFGHFYFAKRAGILVREFAVGMGPKIFSHTAADGTLYTLRLLPLGGYVRMAGWGEDKTEIRTGHSASLSFNEKGLVSRINLSDRVVDQTALPIAITSYDLEDSLEVMGLVAGESKSYAVDQNATIIEEDGTEVRIAPLDVQYQNASVWGRLMTNFAGPMNNFILGIVVFTLIAFLQGGVRDYTSNTFLVADNGPLSQAGLSGQVTIYQINHQPVTDWESLSQAVQAGGSTMVLELSDGDGTSKKEVTITPKQEDDRYLIGVSPDLKTGFWDKLKGGFAMAWESAFAIATALKNLILKPDVTKLGGPIAIYQMSSSAAKEGLLSVLTLMAMLSMNLGIFNLLPIPALDGGKILLNIIEAIRKKPLKQETEGYITLAGVALMLLLTIAVTWNDIVRTFF